MSTVAWLLERPATPDYPASYWNPDIGWTIDPKRAIWFARQFDAESYKASRNVMSGASWIVSTEHVFGLVPTPAEPGGMREEHARLKAERDILLDLHQRLIPVAGMSRDTSETFVEWMKLTREAGEKLFALAGTKSILLDALADHALSPPTPGVGTDIEAIKKAAYQEGWNDREDDLIAGVNRIVGPTPTPQEETKPEGETAFVTVTVGLIQALAAEIHHDQHGPSAWARLTDLGRQMYFKRTEDAIRRAEAANPPSPGEQDGEWRPTHRHVKRGTEYQYLGWGRAQCSESGLLDDEHVAIYRGQDGSWWARRLAEFNDGRFEPLPPPPSTDKEVK